ncbi:MAG TPA: hypothetical protein VJB15_09155 [Rhodothermia bacterium]|nr:hypothetical protein [Rhodothermia bacterium]
MTTIHYTAGDEDELTLEVTAYVFPGRPAPACSNPDSPAFSDAGDPPEVDIQAVRVIERKGDTIHDARPLTQDERLALLDNEDYCEIERRLIEEAIRHHEDAIDDNPNADERE